MEIRRALPDDAPELGRFHVAAWRAAYRGIIPDERLDLLDPVRRAGRFRESLEREAEETYLIEEDGYLLGFLTLGACRDEDAPGAGEIWGIYVHPTRLSRGIGTRLLEFGEDLLRRRGYGQLKLWVLERNDSSRRFYEARGYRLDGRRKEHPRGTGQYVVSYEKRVERRKG